MVFEMKNIIPQADTMMTIPTIPPSIWLRPFSRAVESSPCMSISTIPHTKTTTATANMSITIGSKILAIIGSTAEAKAAVGSGAA